MRSVAILLCAAAAVALSGCPCGGPGVPATLTPLEDQLGYEIDGLWDFSGTLTKPESEGGNWVLEGSFVFATGGFEVQDPEVIVRESFPEQVSVILTVVPPPPGAPVTQVITEVPVRAEIAASDEAMFEVLIRTACPEFS